MCLGIVLYGPMPDRELQIPFALDSVMELRSIVACARTLGNGSCVSYGRTITADDIAGLCGTIGYEIVCGISKRVPRIIYRNNKIVDVVRYD